MSSVAVQGFSYNALHVGLKKKRLDLALVAADRPVACAALFTQNRVVAAPVLVAQEHCASGYAQAILVNAGNANACTGEQGRVDAENMCANAAAALGCTADDVLCASTGVIGVPLPVEKISNNIDELVKDLAPDDEHVALVSQAIMTTDTCSKVVTSTFEHEGRTYTITGLAKGSGMIAPNMATMIGVLLTDAPISPAVCDSLLRLAAAHTFNAVTVDGDTSTNDTLIFMASGAAGGTSIDAKTHPAFEAALIALFDVCEKLAAMIAADGEGATKMVDVVVTGASTCSDATQMARTIAESPLVKTALFGNDANWGRVAGAAGRSGVAFDPNALSITFAGIQVCAHGEALGFDEDEALAALSQKHVSIHVDLGQSNTPKCDFDSTFTAHPHEGSARIMTCDLSYDYVRINGEYRS